MTANDPWNPSQYERFRREREQPFFDLLALVEPAPDMDIVDLGCGTGRGTVLLHERLNARTTTGIDRSARMLEQRPVSARPDGLTFRIDTIESLPAEAAYDLVFSNSALHWVPNHRALVQQLVRALEPRGQLAFQIPAMHDDAGHTIAEALADSPPYREALGGWTRLQPVLPPDTYTRILYAAGLRPPRVSLHVYPHVLAGPEEVVEWYRGSLLTDYERRLEPAVFDAFVADYRQRVLAALPDERPYVFAFKRILAWGRLE